MDPFEYGMMLRGNHPMQVQERRMTSEGNRNFIEKLQEHQERRENQAKAEDQMGKSADAFVNALVLNGNEPWDKLGVTEDEYYNLGANQRAGMVKGLMLAEEYQNQLATAKAANQQREDTAKQREDTAAFYRELPLQPARRNAQTAMQNGVGGILDTLAQWSQADSTSPNAEDLRSTVARHPYAGLDPVIARSVMSATEAGPTGKPQVDLVDLPFGNKGAVLRGSKDLKTFMNPENQRDRTEMTDYQKAQLINQARARYIEAKRQHDTLSAMKEDTFAQSLLPGAKDALNSAVEELKGYGIESKAATPAAYQSAEAVKAAFKSGAIDRATAKKILAEQFNMK